MVNTSKAFLLLYATGSCADHMSCLGGMSLTFFFSSVVRSHLFLANGCSIEVIHLANALLELLRLGHE